MQRLAVDLFLVAAFLLMVAAFVFRSREARRLIALLRNLAWVYILLVFAVGAYRLWQYGF